MEGLAGIRGRYDALVRVLDGRGRRLAVAAESKALGPGGISTVGFRLICLYVGNYSLTPLRNTKSRVNLPADGTPQFRIVIVNSARSMSITRSTPSWP